MSYSDKVIDHYNNPRNVGSMDKKDADVGTGLVGAPECGDVMKLQIKVNPQTNVIEDAKFKTFGCGSAIASSSLATEWVKGKTIDEALAIKNTEIVKELALPPVKIHCSVLAEDAIKAALGDAGYYSETNAADLKQRGIEPYLATERLKHHEKVASAPRGRIPKGLSAKQRMARKLRTKTGRELYAKRKGMIEPVFGQLKQVLGFRQCSMRGLATMRGEWRLMCTVHNLLKLWRHAEMAVAG